MVKTLFLLITIKHTNLEMQYGDKEAIRQEFAEAEAKLHEQEKELNDLLNEGYTILYSSETETRQGMNVVFVLHKLDVKEEVRW